MASTSPWHRHPLGWTPKTMISDPVVVCLTGSGSPVSDLSHGDCERPNRRSCAAGDRESKTAVVPGDRRHLERQATAPRQTASRRAARPGHQPSKLRGPAAQASPPALSDASLGRFVSGSRGDLVGPGLRDLGIAGRDQEDRQL